MPQLNSNCGSSALHEERALIYPVTATPREGHFACVRPMSQLRSKIDDIDEGFGHWFAGFVDGEGHFDAYIGEYKRYRKGKSYFSDTPHIGFVICLRDDDSNIIELIRAKLGIGRVRYNENRRRKSNAKPIACFEVYNLKDIVSILIPLFDKYPLRTKKRRDYEIWREIVLIKYPYVAKHEHYPIGIKNRLRRLSRQLRDGRRYIGHGSEYLDKAPLHSTSISQLPLFIFEAKK